MLIYQTNWNIYLFFYKPCLFPLHNKTITVFVWWIIKLVLSMKIDCLCLMILPPFSSQVKEPSSSIVISEIEKKCIYHWFLFINLNNQNVTIFSFYFFFIFYINCLINNNHFLSAARTSHSVPALQYSTAPYISHYWWRPWMILWSARHL